MPIHPDLRQHYGRAWREEIRPRILERAGHCCEQCGKPDRWQIATVTMPYWPRMYWRPFSPAYAPWRNAFGEATVLQFPEKDVRRITVILTVAHLNHIAGDNRDENLKALCQWCHLHYDHLHHKTSRSTRKDAARPLLAVTQAEL